MLSNRVPCNESRVWVVVGRILIAGYPTYAVVPPRFALVPLVGMAKASATLTASFRHMTPMTNYTVWGYPKHLMHMCFPHAPLMHMCFPHAPHTQHSVPLRQCMHKRQLAKQALSR